MTGGGTGFSIALWIPRRRRTAHPAVTLWTRDEDLPRILGRVDATNVGRLLAASGTSDLVDAHVVICARRTGQQVVTSDPGDLRLLDPAVRLIAI